MPTIPLPENPSLEHLKNQAKLVRDLIRSGDEGALGMIDEFHSRYDVATLPDEERQRFKTIDAQLIVARMYGFPGWPQLRAYLDIVSERSFTPLGESAALSPVDAFVVGACLDYSGSGPRPEVRIAQAHRMLAADPTLASGSIAALATVGDHAGLGTAIDETPDALNAPCGANRWPPLLYATYARIASDNPDRSAIETVSLLLDRGADPNAGFLWRGLVPPFTALTGALGGGENHQPWHAERLELARLLLDAGADPNDGQSLYNNGIGGQNHDIPAHLQLLVEYGLGVQQDGPWYQQLGDRLRDPAELLYDELEAAAKRNRPTILRYLLGQGLDPTRPVGRSQMTPARIAAAEGNDAILDVLAEHGIAIDLTPAEQALRCVRSNNLEALNSLLDEHPELLKELRRDRPSLCSSISSDAQAILTRLIGLGFDINDRSAAKTPLHHAAEAGDTDRARLLIDHGADPNLCDSHIGATPWGWANHFGHSDTADFLHARTHHDGSLPQLTLSWATGSTTLATPSLIDSRLNDVHRERRPTLLTLRHDRSALTIGLGHPRASVALYLDQEGLPWHAVPDGPVPGASEIVWASTSGSKEFNPDTYLTVTEARGLASSFVADPGDKPSAAVWRREGTGT